MKTKIRVKVMAVLLTLIMCLTLLPTRVFAGGTPVTSLTFTVTGYGLGMDVSGIKLEHENPGIRIQSWYVDRHIDGGGWVKATGVFEAYTLYAISIFFEEEEGYDCSGLKDKKNVKVNGKEATYFDNPWTSTPEGKIRVFHYFPELKKPNGTYIVTISDTEHGSVSADKTSDLSEGDVVTLTITPDAGYQLYSLIITDRERKLIKMETPNTFKMLGADVNVKATFEEVIPEGQVRVAFEVGMFGTAPPRQVINKGNKAKKPDDPTEAGWKFKGWYTEDTYINLFDFNTPITENIILYAKWAPEGPYTVTFDSNGGSAVPQQTVNDGEKATKPADPTKAGHNFAGWYTDAACTTLFDFNTAITEDITLYAKWVENGAPAEQVTVTFNANGHGIAPAAQTINKGNKATKPTDPTEAGWKFEGWYKEAECTNLFDFDTPIEENITLYAKWTKEGGGIIYYPIIPDPENEDKKEDETTTVNDTKPQPTTDISDNDTPLGTTDDDDEEAEEATAEYDDDDDEEESSEEDVVEEDEEDVDVEKDTTPLGNGLPRTGGSFGIIYVLLGLGLSAFGLKKLKKR